MSTQSMKENQINSSGDYNQVGLKGIATPPRPPLGAKNTNTIKQAVSIPPQVQNQQLQQQIAKLEQELKQERAIREKQTAQISELTLRNQVLDSSLTYFTHVENTAKITNNRIRQINKLHIEKKELLEQIGELKDRINTLESEQISKLDITLNNKRIRKIHQLHNENKQLKETVQQQQQQLNHLSHQVVVASTPKSSNSNANQSPSKINYNTFISHRSIPTTSDYGLEDDHAPGEC